LVRENQMLQEENQLLQEKKQNDQQDPKPTK